MNIDADPTKWSCGWPSSHNLIDSSPYRVVYFHLYALTRTRCAVSWTGAVSIRIRCGYWETSERKSILVAQACNHPNCLVLPFSLELIRLAA
jgi:hypothetical protein